MYPFCQRWCKCARPSLLRCILFIDTGLSLSNEDIEEYHSSPSTNTEVMAILKKKKKSPHSASTGTWRGEVSAAERDLRLLSEKANRSFRNSRFDIFLGRFHLVTPWVLLLMTVSYGLQIGILVLEELSDFQVGFVSVFRSERNEKLDMQQDRSMFLTE